MEWVGVVIIQLGVDVLFLLANIPDNELDIQQHPFSCRARNILS